MVDWGDDVALSVKLSGILDETHTKLKPDGMHRIRSSVGFLRNLTQGNIVSLQDMRNSGIHPSTLASNGVCLGPLLKKHGFDALIDYGFGWNDMRDMGLTAKQACSMNASQLRKLGVNAYKLMEVRPSIACIASMRMSAAELRQFGFDSDLLVAAGLRADNMAQFGYSISEWKRTVGLTGWHQLGFKDYSTCERMGWSRTELHAHNIIESSAPQPRTARVTPTVGPRAGLEF